MPTKTKPARITATKRSVNYDIKVKTPTGSVTIDVEIDDSRKLTIRPQHGGSKFEFLNSEPALVSGIAEGLLAAVDLAKEEKL